MSRGYDGLNQQAEMKRRVHEILEVWDGGDWLSQGVDWLLLLLIITNVAALVISTEQSIYDAAPGFFLLVRGYILLHIRR